MNTSEQHKAKRGSCLLDLFLRPIVGLLLPACRRLLFPLFPRATKEIGDVCAQARVIGVVDSWGEGGS